MPIREKKPAQPLAELLNKDFEPFIETKFKAKRKTPDYYKYGIKGLLDSPLAKLRLDKITDQHAGQYAAKRSCLAASTVNCGLRTLRRALKLAVEWGKMDRMPKLSPAKGERQRERVLTDEEVPRYLEGCPQPWHDAVITILGTGMRPGEVFPLRWETTSFNGNGGPIRITEGKSKTARRTLPMVPEVFAAPKARHLAQGEPAEGWVFPAKSASGHLEQGTAKKQHAKALKNSGVKPFEPYRLRHTALTNMGSLGIDSFTLARIAGHSSITMTQRYCHPQRDAIERAFAVFGQGQKVVTEGGHREKSEEKENLKPTVSD
jgi:integrase